MTPAALYQETDSTRGSMGRPVSGYSQDDASQSESASNSYVSGRQHQRNKSLHVNWTQEDVERMAKEIYDESIAAVHLSLLGYWICEMPQHYEMARTHIRELSLDQGYSVQRIKNDHLLELLNSTMSVRPVQAQEKIAGKAAPVVHFEQSQADRNPFDRIYHAKLEVLPSSLRRKPESGIQEQHDSSALSSPTREYPPNTPDRPQPLSLRSMYSGKSSATPSSSVRSVSTPIIQSNRKAAIPFPRNSIGLDEITSQLPLLTSATESSTVSNGRGDDVFGISGKEDSRRSDPFDLRHAVSTTEIEHHGTKGVAIEHDLDFLHGGYELASSDASSRTGHDGTYSRCSTSLLRPTSEPSILESVSTDKEDKHRTQYTYGSSTPTAAPSPTPILGSGSGSSPRSLPGRLRHRTSQWAQTFLFGPRPNLVTGDFYRPALFPASGGAGFVTIETTTYITKAESEKLDKDYDENDDLPFSPSRHTLESEATNKVIAGFPIPGVENPVCMLPMLVAAATSPPDLIIDAQSTSQESASPFDSSNDPEVLATQIRFTLVRTRARGDALPLEDWTIMSPFEQAWREANEELLIWIFGRQDTWLSAGDVSSVDCVGRKIKANEGHWVVEVLKEEAEMF